MIEAPIFLVRTCTCNPNGSLIEATAMAAPHRLANRRFAHAVREVWGEASASLPPRVWGMVKKLNGIQFYVAVVVNTWKWWLEYVSVGCDVLGRI